MPVSIRQLEPHLRKIVAGWHPELRRTFRKYLSSTSLGSRSSGSKRAFNDPYWFLIPQWLAQSLPSSPRTDHKFLLNILRGQYFVFLALKIHDDIFDGHVGDRPLLFAADHFFLSARQEFVPFFPANSSFWSFFDSSLAHTLNAIIAVDQSQLHCYGSPSSVATLITQMYSVCNIATYAVCLRAKRIRSFQSIVRCTDELAFVGQLLDDLEDMMVDFERGRVNYTARFLSGPSIDGKKNLTERIAKNIILNGSTDRFFEMLQNHLQRASEIACTTAIPMLVDYVETYRIELRSLGTQLHRKRVQVLFESALKRQRWRTT